MKLCGETLLFLNAAIDTGLLVCSARLCGEQLRWRRMILAGFLAERTLWRRFCRG